MAEDRVRSRADGSSARRARSEQAGQDALSGAEAQDRSSSDKPDVFLDVPELHVGEIHLDVDSLDAHLSLQARLANLVELTAGVHVHVGKVELDIKDVDAKAVLKVRLENLYNILDRALTTVERNPEILQGLLSTAGTAVESVGQTAQQAVQPGGAVRSLTDGVAAVGQDALGPGGAATEAVASAGGVAEEALGPGGAATRATEGVTDTTSHAAQVSGAAVESAGAADRASGGGGDAASEEPRGVRRSVPDARHAAVSGTPQPRRPSSRQPGRPGSSGRLRRQGQHPDNGGSR
jgi:hypothetical protein